MTRHVAAVTGGSRGLGRACAVALAEAGWTVAIGYRSSETDAKEAVAALEAAGMPGLAVYMDITDESSVQEAFRRIGDEVGPVTGLVNNAGFSQDGLLVKYSLNTYDRVMATNVRGSFLCTQAALRGMLRAKWGRIVNMSSAVALHGNAGQTVYAASKTALLGLTTSLAREVGAKGITVNAVCPGMIDTELTRESAAPEVLERLAKSYPVPRLGTSIEVADLICFVASEAAGYITGASLDINGGDLMM